MLRGLRFTARTGGLSVASRAPYRIFLRDAYTHLYDVGNASCTIVAATFPKSLTDRNRHRTDRTVRVRRVAIEGPVMDDRYWYLLSAILVLVAVIFVIAILVS
jgi:hypothetical protein